MGNTELIKTHYATIVYRKTVCVSTSRKVVKYLLPFLLIGATKISPYYKYNTYKKRSKVERKGRLAGELTAEEMIRC